MILIADDHALLLSFLLHTHTFSTLAFYDMPYFQKTLQEWRTFFLIAVVISVAMDIIILLFWKSEIQPFAKTAPSDQRPDSAIVEA